jgi:FtsZ-binding cell division protein ZapB
MSNKCLDCVPANEEECNVCEGMKEIKNAAIETYKALYEQDIKELKARIADLEQINEQHRLLNGQLHQENKMLKSRIFDLVRPIDSENAIDGD